MTMIPRMLFVLSQPLCPHSDEGLIQETRDDKRVREVRDETMSQTMI